ncbi:Polysaccharide deacetylase [Andreprevotia lacus DSM 23236]|jgi:peptidoglycan/xylan/chitin deacetylase (PgdA/CDA1 family)|uniref:Polysaccharide deacetylase n=1 Tax=Andreprevotia lacus DSM 23236 TaxID=1121001 RepID=A0A1W1X2X4_9NEIS|nr:carbohydrate-binding protein [Andreprevotia lacus]SMC18078.1 Polysaccharide deacetylase [Andreprevotia lacus DSM 23236]
MHYKIITAALALLGLAGSAAAAITEWQDGASYTVGQIVQYQGQRYQDLQAHTAWTGAGWNPHDAVSLWKPLGSCTTTAGNLCNPVGVTAAAYTTWAGGAKGAYSLVHDDYCAYITDGQISNAEPELTKRGLHATFAVITANCAPYHWQAAKQFIAHGHEIASHSRNHFDSNTAAWNSSAEIDGSASDIAAHLDGYKVGFFAWPSDIAPDAPMNYLKSAANYIGGRAASRVDENNNIIYGTAAGVNDANFTNPYNIKWDLFTNSGIWSLYPMGSEILNLHVDAAIAQGGWALRTAHGVGDQSWETIPVDRYIAHLDYVKSKVDAGDLWMATPSQVIRYRFARQNCSPAVTLDGNGQALVHFATGADCLKYGTDLTLDIATDRAVTAAAATQAGQPLAVKLLDGSHVRVTVNPTLGDASLQLR